MKIKLLLLFAIVFLSGCITNLEFTPTVKSHTDDNIPVNYKETKLISDKKLLETGLNNFVGKPINELFPYFGHPTSSFTIGEDRNYKYIFKENPESTAYSTYYSSSEYTSITTVQKQLTISLLTDKDAIIKEYYVDGDSNYYKSLLAYKFINYYPIKCVKNGDELINYKTKIRDKKKRVFKKVSLYYCEKCLYSIKFSSSINHFIDNK